MKTTFTNDEFRKLIYKAIYAAHIYGTVYDVDTAYEDVEGNCCLAFINDYDDDGNYIFPWDEIKSITYSETFHTFVITTNDENRCDVRLLTSYVPCW